MMPVIFMPKILGFGRKEEAAEKKDIPPAIKNVEKEFQQMIKELEIEEEASVRELILEKKVRKELVKLYKRTKKLEKKIVQRNALLAQCQALAYDSPKKSLELLDAIGAMDAEIVPEAEGIARDLSQHALPDIAGLYKDLELSDEQRKQIRTLANTLSSTLSIAVRPVYEAMQHQQLDSLRRNILMKNPQLK